MDILVLYGNIENDKRQNVLDHLYSFRRYVSSARFFYVDASNPERISGAVCRYAFDAIILHYSLLVKRFLEWDTAPLIELLKQQNGVKVMIPHDDYYATAKLWEIIEQGGVDIIYASCPPRDYDTIYPREEIGPKAALKTAFTGYVDDELAAFCKKLAQPIETRKIKIGYKGGAGSYYFGEHGMLKTRLANAFLHELGLPNDGDDLYQIATGGTVYALQGDDWIRFLASCRASLGCLGGSSLFDPKREVAKRTEAYLTNHPDATEQQIIDNCYGDADGKISCFLLGPRHFENAMTKTCQFLVEGDYQGVLRPGLDYVEIKRDFSNVSEVIAMADDPARCQQIADSCYAHVVESGNYTYRKFANGIVADIAALQDPKSAESAVAFYWMAARQRVAQAFAAVKNSVAAFFKKLYSKLTDWFSKLFPKAYEKLRARISKK